MDVPCPPWPPTSAFRWVRGLSGVPDVPHALDQRSLADQYSGVQCVGNLSVHPKQAFRANEPVLITFSLRDTADGWEAVVLNKKLFLRIPKEGLPEGSKEAMTELLEFAEESLKVTDVVISFEKERSDRMQVIRTLMYLGFESLAPENPVVPTEMADSSLYSMAYNF